MAQPGTDQHEGRVAVWKTTHHTGAATDLPVQPLNDIVGSDASPVLAGKVTVGQGFLNTVLHLLGRFFQFHGAQFLHHGFGFLSGGFLALLGMDRLEHLGYQPHFGAWRD